MSFTDTDTCEFIKLSKTHRWVVDNREVQIGALCILCKPDINDTMDEFKTFGNREMKKRSLQFFLYGKMRLIMKIISNVSVETTQGN